MIWWLMANSQLLQCVTRPTTWKLAAWVYAFVCMYLCYLYNILSHLSIHYAYSYQHTEYAWKSSQFIYFVHSSYVQSPTYTHDGENFHFTQSTPIIRTTIGIHTGWRGLSFHSTNSLFIGIHTKWSQFSHENMYFSVWYSGIGNDTLTADTTLKWHPV